MRSRYCWKLAAVALAGHRHPQKIGYSMVGLCKRVRVYAPMVLALAWGGLLCAQNPSRVPGQPAPTVCAASRIPGATIPDGLGVNIHWTNPRPGEMRMLAATGVRWIRMDFAW
ncbi:MAG: hypothetical protein HKL95_03075, partial [Phycisphaerae bacterium]|nr:hypothetical protein [Phycisphaerae bacterium]